MDGMTDNSDTSTLSATVEVSSVETPDSELVARVRAGEEEAFEELFNRHRRRVALIASRFFRQRQEIEEIVQESFTKAFFALPEFSNQQDNSFASWLARIAFNTCYDELRRLKRRPESALSNVNEEEAAWIKEQARGDGAGQDIESTAVARDLAEKLLSRLSPEDRLVLLMLDVEGMSVSDIARTNKWTDSKVKVRAHRARESLRRVLRKFL